MVDIIMQAKPLWYKSWWEMRHVTSHHNHKIWKTANYVYSKHTNNSSWCLLAIFFHIKCYHMQNKITCRYTCICIQCNALGKVIIIILWLLLVTALFCKSIFLPVVQPYGPRNSPSSQELHLWPKTLGLHCETNNKKGRGRLLRVFLYV